MIMKKPRQAEEEEMLFHAWRGFFMRWYRVPAERISDALF